METDIVHTSKAVLRIVRGGLYRYHRGGLYRVISIPLDPHGCQDIVVYVGVTGRDAGREFSCSLWNFAVNFTDTDKVPAEGKPVAAPVEKVAGRGTVGLGV